jgi:hypothetical protein
MLTVNFIDVAVLPIMAFAGKVILEFVKFFGKANGRVWEISR